MCGPAIERHRRCVVHRALLGELSRKTDFKVVGETCQKTNLILSDIFSDKNMRKNMIKFNGNRLSEKIMTWLKYMKPVN